MENAPTYLDVRKIRSLDGLYYSFLMLDHYYEGLHELCCEIIPNNAKIVPALASCWGIIDVVHRIREIALSTPGINSKNLEMRAFIEKTNLAEDYRHYIQHLRNELAAKPPQKFPVWGTLSWVNMDDQTQSHIVLLGAQIEGTQYDGCVFDTFEKKWVSKVTLSVDQKSFNFDPMYESCIRFKNYIIPILMKGASTEVKYHNKLTVISTKSYTGD